MFESSNHCRLTREFFSQVADNREAKKVVFSRHENVKRQEK